MTDYIADVLTFAHILCAIGWLGGAMLSNIVLGPVMPRMTPAGRKDILTHFFPRFARVTAAFAGLTVLFGISLYVYLMTGVDNPAWMQTLGVGILLALIAFAIGVGFILPKTFQLPKLLAAGDPAGPPSAEFQRTLRQVQMASLVVMFVLIGTVAFMVAAAGVA
jgi:uncharacterized membrane protein